MQTLLFNWRDELVRFKPDENLNYFANKSKQISTFEAKFNSVYILQYLPPCADSHSHSNDSLELHK